MRILDTTSGVVLSFASLGDTTEIAGKRPFLDSMAIFRMTAGLTRQRIGFMRRETSFLPMRVPPELCRASAPVSPCEPGALVDSIPDAALGTSYSVEYYYGQPYSDARDPGISVVGPVSWRPPTPVNPSSANARNAGLQTVELRWTPAPRGFRYRVDGSGLPNTGLVVDSTHVALKNVPIGPARWTIVTLYPGKLADFTSPAIATLAMAQSLPARTTPFLSKSNGVGNLATTVAHYYPHASATPLQEPDLLALANVSTFKSWINTSPLPNSPLGRSADEAVYGNASDLGVGRRADCFQEIKGLPVPGLRTVCYAAAHGIAPGMPGFNDLAVITRPAPGQAADFILAMMIIKDPQGTQFLVFNKVNGNTTTLAPTASLDGEGPKFVPHTCTPCHGGKYNPRTNRVDNSQFLPLDPQLLAFSSATARAQQEEKIRKLNAIMMNSDPTSAVARYIRGLYQGQPTLPNSIAKDDFIPSSWSQQPGLYRQVVRPYCVMCHLAAPPALDFSNYANFEAASGVVYGDVCLGHTMPHSELQFTQFWTKVTGAIYIPGLLASWTGNPGCP